MTDTKKFDTVVPIVTKPVEEIIPTPAQQMIEDSATKKKIIYHQPPRKANYAADKARYNELCGDSYKITLGYPMTWVEFNQISDSMRKEYIESMLEKYPGISSNALAWMFNADPRVINTEANRLGIFFAGKASNDIQHNYRMEIEEIKAKIESGESPRNLRIDRKEDLSKLKRKHYNQVKKMKPADAFKYINGIYMRYSKTLSINDFADMMGCSKSSVHVLFNDIGFKFENCMKNFCSSNEAKIIRAKFREEMIEPNSNKYTRRKYTRKSSEEKPKAEVVEIAAITEQVEEVAQPVEEEKTTLIPMKDIPSVEFYDPATVMEGVIPADREIEDSADEPSEADTQFNITSIDAEVDADKVADFIKYIGFTGKVKIHIEKI